MSGKSSYMHAKKRMFAIFMVRSQILFIKMKN